MIAPDSIGDYGDATERLRAVIAEARSIRCFEQPSSDRREAKAEALVREHLDHLGPAPPTIRGLRWLQGSLALLHQNRWGIDPYEPWGPRWAESRRMIVDPVVKLRARIKETPEAARIKPPLWPLAGHPNVCNPILAEDAALGPIGLDKGKGDPRDRVVAWCLLCEADSHIQDALLMELTADLIPSSNPYLPLIGLYRLGCFPMGWEDGAYTLYIHDDG